MEDTRLSYLVVILIHFYGTVCCGGTKMFSMEKVPDNNITVKAKLL